jgi:transposase
MVIRAVKNHLRHVLLWLYDKNNAISRRDAAEEINEVYGQGTIGDWACGKWLKRFRDGEKDVDDLEDRPRSGRPSNFDDDELRRLVEEDPKRTTRELAAILQKDNATIWRHLQAIGMVSSFFCFDLY